MYVITPGCCNDASCVSVCPVNCIHPTPDEPDFGATPTLYVDPAVCIDCGACADACPVDAISPAEVLRGPQRQWIDVNRHFFDTREPFVEPELRFLTAVPAAVGELRIAVVGTGPAAQYTSDLLLRVAGARVTMIDRLAVPGGLLRYGVAPDHPETRRLGDRFAGYLHNPRLRLMLNVEVGRDVSVADLAEHFDAVVYAVGASTGRDLGVPGEHLPGSVTATEFVAWYNAHPDANEVPAGLQTERAVIVGNGNVAIDVARILVTDPDRLAATDIADRALAALRDSHVREVVISARRGPDVASYTAGELMALRHLPGVELAVADTPGVASTIAAAAPGSQAALLVGVPLVNPDWSAPPPAGRRIVLQFDATPTAITGDDAVTGADFTASVTTGDTADDTIGNTTGDTTWHIPAGLVVRAIGYHGRPIPGLPYDEATGRIPNTAGRVDGGAPGTYVVGWIKRGARGGIGANRQDATQTVRTLIDDAVAGRLRPRERRRRGLARLLASRGVTVLDAAHAQAVDDAERAAGLAAGRPRVKLASTPELLAAGRGPRERRS